MGNDGLGRTTDRDYLNEQQTLADAIANARQFAATSNPGDVIDESGFTPDNLLALIATAAPPFKEDALVNILGDLA